MFGLLNRHRPRKTFYIGGKADSMADGVKLAADIIDTGKAAETLDKFVEVSNI